MNEVKRTLWLGLISAILISVVSCTVPGAATPIVSEEVPAEDTVIVSVDAEGVTSVEPVALEAVLEDSEVNDLDPQEIQGLLYMREEEKLAHDVYAALYDLWGLPIFGNIADSEATHTEAVRALLERYNLEDPAVGSEAGVFVDATLQGLYDELVAKGSESLEAAIRVGAAIEEIDILDLTEYIAATDEEDIVLVYENLMRGSRNHLRAFVSTLDRQTGLSYEPGYLDAAIYESIVTAETERGSQN